MQNKILDLQDGPCFILVILKYLGNPASENSQKQDTQDLLLDPQDDPCFILVILKYILEILLQKGVP